MKKIISLLMVFLLLSLCGCAKEGVLLSQEAEPVQAIEEAAPDEQTEAASSDDSIYVYVCGEVVSPGVYPLAAHSRVYEAVEAAGGMTDAACADGINLAQELSDGQMINIPDEEDMLSAGAGTGQTAVLTDGTVNINTATKEDLMTLSGIGEAKAESILAYREANGSFDSPEDLMEVDGIGQGIYAKIKEKIVV